MSLLDPNVRTQLGEKLQTELTGKKATEPTSLLEASWRDFIYAEVWSRPGLDRRSRFLISIAGAACEGCSSDIIENYVRGALTTGELTQAELREAALHLAVYAGWSRGTVIDKAITKVARELDMPLAEIPPIRGEAWDPQVRLAEGAANFTAVMTFPSPPPVVPYFEAGIVNFVFGEMWMRPGLDQRSRRWVTMVGVSESASTTPIRTHTYAAMASGNATLPEMHEFILQYAIHGGWPKASVMQAVVFEMGKRVTEGLPYA